MLIGTGRTNALRPLIVSVTQSESKADQFQCVSAFNPCLVCVQSAFTVRLRVSAAAHLPCVRSAPKMCNNTSFDRYMIEQWC